MKKWTKYSLRAFSITIIIAVILMAFSFLFPGSIKPIDHVRISVQEVALKYTSENYVSDFTHSSKYTDGMNQINYEEFKRYFDDMSTGDIFFTQSVNYICSEITPGRWKHAVIYIGDRKQFEQLYTSEDELYDTVVAHYVTGEEVLILDSSKFGVSIRKLDELSNLQKESLLKSVIGFRLIAEADNKKEFINSAASYIGLDYDYDMNINDKSSLYCSELLYQALSSINIMIDVTNGIAGRSYITPTDAATFLTKSDMFEITLFLEKNDGILIDNLIGEVAIKR